MSDDEDYFYGTSSSWSGCYGSEFGRNDEQRDYSKEFELRDKPGIKFVMFFNGEDGPEDCSIGVVMEKNESGERVKLDVQMWIEDWDNVESEKFKGLFILVLSTIFI
jgi:hypothetical protein